MSMDNGSRKTALAYVRISDRKQKDGESPETQKASIQGYADRNNIEVIKWFYDEAKSGKNADRPQLQALLRYAIGSKTKIDHVIVYKMNRASRDIDSYVSVRMLLKKKNITMRSSTENIDDSKAGRFMETMMVLLGELDNESKAEATLDNMKALARQGYWQHAPIVGYRNTKILNDVGKPRPSMTPDKMSAKVKQVFERFAQGDINQSELNKYAGDIGLRSKKGNRLSITSINRLLTQPAYAGYIANRFTDNELVFAKHEPIISIDIFNTVQQLLNSNTLSRKGQTVSKQNELYPLKRLLLCHNCKLPLYGSAPKSGGGGHSARYHCARKQCRGIAKSVKADQVHQAYVELLTQIQPSDGVLSLYQEVLVMQAARENGRINTKIKQQRDVLDEIATSRLNAIQERAATKDAKEKGELSELVDKLDGDKKQATSDLKELEELQSVQEANIRYAVDNMYNIAAQWVDADYDLRQGFQSTIFPEGLILNTQTLEFGTTKISPLYRYVGNKKDLSEAEKSHLVTPRRIELRLPD